MLQYVYNLNCSGTANKGPSERRTALYKGQFVMSQNYIFRPPRRGQPLYSGRNGWSQKCPLLGGSTVHKEEDNLSIVDKMAGPNVSFIQRFHCT